jgi:hypothetical protein
VIQARAALLRENRRSSFVTKAVEWLVEKHAILNHSSMARTTFRSNKNEGDTALNEAFN